MTDPVARLLARFESPDPPAAVPSSLNGSFDLEGFITRHGLPVRRRAPWNGGEKWELETCPFNADHTGGCAVITRGAGGALGFKCHHNGCSGRGWHELREHLDPVAYRQRNERADGNVVQVAGLTAISATDLLLSKLAAPQPIIERILYRGLVVFHGRPKCGKSWWALQIAIALVRGEQVGGALGVTRPYTVLYLALEEPEWRTSSRLQQLRPGGLGSLDGLTFIYNIQPLLAGGGAQLAEYLAEHQTDVLIIDTRLALMQQAGSKGNVVQGDYNAWRTIQDIAHKFNLAVIVIDHSRKGGGDITESMITTTGGAAAVDCLWRLKRTPEGKGEFEVLGRETEGECFEMVFGKGGEDDPFGWRIVAEGAEVGMSEQRADILELLKAEGALKPSQIAGKLRKNAVTVRRLLMKMYQDDLIRQNSDKTYYATGRKK